MIKTAEHALEAVNASMTPGQFLVDMIPIRMSPSVLCTVIANLIWLVPVRFLPEWFPGIKFKRQARLWRASTEQVLHGPLKLARELLVSIN